MASEIRPYIPSDFPFSLVCSHCDAGMDIRSYEQATAAGWSDIDYAPGLPMANFLGICPDCLEAYENWPASDA